MGTEGGCREPLEAGLSIWTALRWGAGEGAPLVLRSLSGRYVWPCRRTGWTLEVPPHPRSLAAPLGGHRTSLSFTRVGESSPLAGPAGG